MGAQALGALRHRNYRLFFIGQTVFTLGSWMQGIALPWVTLERTHSAFLLGVLGLVQYLPMIVAGPVGGMIADRLPKRTVLQLTLTLFTLVGLFLYAMSWRGTDHYWVLLVTAAVWGLIQLVDAPCRQAASLEVVGPEDLLSVISLNTTTWNAAAVIGPVVAGVVVATIGAPWCFLATSIASLCGILSLVFMHSLPVVLREGQQPSRWQHIVEGARVAMGQPVIVWLMIVTLAFSVLASNRMTLLPLLSMGRLHSGAWGFGILIAAGGMGALIANRVFAAHGRRLGGRAHFWVALGWATALVLCGISQWVVLTALLLVAAGAFRMWFLAATGSRIQTLTPDASRGRTMTFYAQATTTGAAVSPLEAGGVAALVGAPFALAAGAGACLLVAIGVRLLQPQAFTSKGEPGGD
ncbi:MAG TPA: MFS transporter [Candidatus Dormibacteraeota bacterium]|nr:MFS transporter [Candidatus Dormibacteraeota bacterium]